MESCLSCGSYFGGSCIPENIKIDAQAPSAAENPLMCYGPLLRRINSAVRAPAILAIWNGIFDREA